MKEIARNMTNSGRCMSESRVSQLVSLYVDSGSFFSRTSEYLGVNGREVIKLKL